MKLIDGKSLASKILGKLKTQVSQLTYAPGLAVILVGDDPASQLYVKLKEKAAKEVGIYFEKHFFSTYTQEKEIIEKIENLNHDPKIHGIIVQLPLPRHLDEDNIIKQINWQKDADGFHPFNIKNLILGQKVIVPGLIKSILTLLKETKVNLRGKKAVILANSDVFIQPLKFILGKKKAEVTFKKSGDYFQDAIREADIVIAAYGRPLLIKANVIKEKAILIDVGTNRTEEGKTVGDVDFEDVKNKAAWLSPVPGGVGPLTVAYLLENTYLNSEYLNKQPYDHKL
ncbi:MAG: bifunctional 5,10-methylenetetrahydrofolate dehydrogenase/5,10-methenyltetrahydrofolate cyclohydrolase [Patescibacteria group bacterium]